VNVDAYVSELVPKGQRGPAFAYNQFVMFTAVPVVAFLAWQLVPRTIFGIDGWRWVVIIGSIGAFVIWWIRRNLPESPRWLEHRGRTSEAERIVGKLERRIRADGADLPPPETVAGETERKTGAWSEMWNAAYRGRTIMLVIYNLFQTVGYYGFSSWAPTLLISQGIEVTKSLTYTFIIAVAADRSADRLVLRGPFRAQMADRMGCGRHSGFWSFVREADRRGRRHLVRTADYALQQLDVVLVSRLSSRALSHPHTRAGGGFRLFMEPVFRHLLRLHHRLFPRPHGTIGVFSFIAGAMAIVVIVIAGFGPAVTNRRLEAIAA